MAAYYFFDVREVRDPDKAAAYRSRVMATVETHGGRYLALGGPFTVVEGDWRPGIPVLIEFPGLAEAQRWYDSADYAPLKALRLAAMDCCAILVEGIAGPEGDDRGAGQ